MRKELYGLSIGLIGYLREEKYSFSEIGECFSAYKTLDEL